MVVAPQIVRAFEPSRTISNFIGASAPPKTELHMSIDLLLGAKARAIGIAWYRPEDYERIREISHDEMQPTFEAFEAKMARMLPQFQSQLPPGVVVEKVVIDPDELLAFSERFHGGKIDTNVRSAFASFHVMQKYGTNH